MRRSSNRTSDPAYYIEVWQYFCMKISRSMVLLHFVMQQKFYEWLWLVSKYLILSLYALLCRSTQLTTTTFLHKVPLGLPNRPVQDRWNQWSNCQLPQNFGRNRRNIFSFKRSLINSTPPHTPEFQTYGPNNFLHHEKQNVECWYSY